MAVLAAAVVACAQAAVGQAAVGDFTLAQCTSETGSSGACIDGAQLGFAAAVAVSPDGKHAYVASWSPGALTIFDRNSVTGKLTERSGAVNCYRETPVGGDCTDVVGMERPIDVAVSPDGKEVYVLGWGSSSVALFDRNATTGRLTQRAGLDGCLALGGYPDAANGNAPRCRAGRALTNGLRLYPSPDFKQIYVPGQTGGASIAVLTVNPDGSLAQAADIDGCVTEDGSDGTDPDGCTDAHAMGLEYELAVSPDGKNVYAASTGTASAVLIFVRDPETGALTQKNGKAGCVSKDGWPDPNNGNTPRCRTEASLARPQAVVVSPDGKTVYALGHDYPTGSIVAFDRSATNGLLTFDSCVNEAGTGGCADARGVSLLQVGAISPDGKALVARNSLSGGTGGMSFFDVAADGKLTQRSGTAGCATRDGSVPNPAGGTLQGECAVAPMLGGEGDIAFVGNTQLYYGGFQDGAAALFARDFRPVCRAATVRVRQATVTPVPLRCSDPNGDPMTLKITTPPLAGTLGAIDQTARRVFYDPFANFVGNDRFFYRGVAKGVGSVPVKVTLDVVPKITIVDRRVKEGNTGTKVAKLTVQLSGASPKTVSVHYATSNGTARAPGDYAAKSGTLTFSPGQTSKTVAVKIVGDRKREADETFFVKLTLPVEAVIADASGRGTIVNND